MGFQTTVNRNPPLAVEGNFASAGVTHNVLAGSQQFVADTTGVTIGRFAYASLATGKVTNAKNAAANVTVGFVRRGDNTAVITTWMGEATMLIPAGYGVTLYDRGDFWVKTKTAATVGQSVFADDVTGEISTGAAGATIAGSTEVPLFKVGSIGAANSLIKITAF